MLVFLKMTRESEVELWPRSSESFIVTDVGAKLQLLLKFYNSSECKCQCTSQCLRQGKQSRRFSIVAVSGQGVDLLVNGYLHCPLNRLCC